MVSELLLTLKASNKDLTVSSLIENLNPVVCSMLDCKPQGLE